MSLRQGLNQWSLRHLPSPIHHALLRWYYRFFDRKPFNADKPPKHLAFVYGFDPDFDSVGQAFLDFFIRHAGLTPESRVLDVGCGIGRCALPLTRFLSADGLYRGFDIRADGIAWCREHIEAKLPNFQFQHVDLRNPTYRPGAGKDPSDFRFPYADGQFDLVFSKSVFTHLDIDTVARYLQETSRVLKPGGLCQHTFFLLNDVSRAAQERGFGQFQFVYPVKGGAAVSRTEPEKAVAFEEAQILQRYQDAALTVVPPIHYGQWCGRVDGVSGQDIIIARKP